jgi:hypothetical protein
MSPQLSRILKGLVLLHLFLLASGCSPKHYVQVHEDSIAFYCEYPDAAEVLFASSIDRYRFHPARKVTADTWEVIVPRGKNFSYFYLVDKKLALPDCTFTSLDDFGARNCLFVTEL